MLLLKIFGVALMWFCVTGIEEYGFISPFGAVVVAVAVPYLVWIFVDGFKFKWVIK